MNQLQIIQDEIYAVQDQFDSVLTDRAISFAKEAEFAMQIMNGNEYMANAARGNPQSLRNAIMNIAAIGITLNPAQKMAYLVPRKVRDKTQICLDISYMGLVQLALQSDSLRLVKAEVICKGEQFVMRGVDQEPIHEYDPLAERPDSAVTGAYCVAKTVNGDFLTEVMSVHEINKIRDTSEAWRNESGRKYCPWYRFYQEMCKKTVIKRASKLWPKGDKENRLDKAIQYLNDNGEGQAKAPQAQIEVKPVVEHLTGLKTVDDLNAYWKSINHLIPAGSPERQEVITAFKSRKEDILSVVDVAPKEEPAEVEQ